MRAEKLAGLRVQGVLESISSELSPPITESTFKPYTKDWAASISKERWRCTKHDTKTKSFD